MIGKTKTQDISPAAWQSRDPRSPLGLRSFHATWPRSRYGRRRNPTGWFSAIRLSLFWL